MKRFLSIFAIMAMIVSMFSGVAFATMHEDDPAEIDLFDDEFYYGVNEIRSLEGRILNFDGSQATTDVAITIENSEGPVDWLPYQEDEYHFTVEDGDLSRTFYVGPENFVVDNYEVTGTYGSGDTITSAAFTVVNEVELEEPTTLDINYSDIDGQMVIQGIFVNGDGYTSESAVQIGYQDSEGNLDDSKRIETADYVTEDEFGFLFDGEDVFTETGKIGIYVSTNEVLAVEGEILADDLDVTMSPTTLVKLDATQEVELSFGTEIGADEQVKLTVGDITVDDDSYGTSYNEDRDVLTVDFNEVFDLSTMDEDDYTLEVDLYNNSDLENEIKDAEITFEVEEADDYNLVNWKAEEISVASTEFFIGSSDDKDTDQYAIEVLDADSKPVLPSVEDFEITYSGAGIDETTYVTADEDLEDKDTFTIKPTETGIIDMEIAVKDGTTTVATFNKEIEVTGLNVSISQTEFVVDTAYDAVVTVVDEDGTPINNATVEIVDEDGNVIDTVDSSTTNINDGLYLFEDLEFDTVGKFDVVADTDSDNKVTLKEEVEVIGQEVYIVDSDMTQLLTGIEDTVTVTVLDADGDVVYPTFYQIDNDVDGKELSSEVITGTRKDLDGDGVKEAVEFDITPDNKAVETVIRATTDAGTRMGQVSHEVLKPELVHTDAEVITEHFETELEFTVVDPRDSSVMELDLDALEVNYGLIDQVESLDDDSDDVWTTTVLVQEVDWEEAADEEDTVKLTVKADGLEVGTIEVVKPTLTSDPEEVIMGTTNNIVLTYLDGEGNPIEDYAVMLDGEEIGDTNADGQVTYATSTVSTSSLEFEAATDAIKDEDTDDETPIYTELTVKSGVDNTAPVITAEVEGNTGLITITDNAKLNKVAINGVELDVFYLGDSVTEMVDLGPGVNTFNVQALDANGNYAQATLELEIEEEAVEGIQFTLDEESEYGTPTLLGNTTMIPVRFAENLGATVSWDAPTATVTYEVNDTVIELTVGSTTAVVNGENVQLAQAPYINELGRTMVPVRMVGEELGFTVHFTSMDAPITIK